MAGEPAGPREPEQFSDRGGRGVGTPVRARSSELKLAAELSFREGRARYILQLPYYLAVVGDEEGLHRYADQAFALESDENERHPVYLAYAIALGKLKHPLAQDMFTRAITTRPTGTWAAHEAYTAYLRETRQYQRVLDLLTPAIMKDAGILREFFRSARCEALVGLGRDREAKSECRGDASRSQPPSSVGSTQTRPRSRPGAVTAAVNYPHNNTADDCRSQAGCAYHPNGGAWCYNYLVWNLTEVALNEALGEAPGVLHSVAWTARDRAIRLSAPGCGGFPGANTSCTSGCPWYWNPQACDLQKKYCCVIHASNQFNRTHIPTPNIPLFVLENTRRVVDGELPDPVSGYIPTGASGCVLNACDGTAYCNTAGSSYDAAPLGPLFFYGNYATQYRCRAVQPGVGVGCAIVAAETCGNSTDGSGSDNCFARSSRVRTWTHVGSNLLCGTGCFSYTTEKRINPGGYAYKIPGEAPPFHNPGGKQADVTLGLYSGAPSTVNVRLYTAGGAVLYDFGNVTVSSSTLSVFTFQSTGVVVGAGNQLRIINNGPGVVKLTQVVSYD